MNDNNPFDDCRTLEECQRMLKHLNRQAVINHFFNTMMYVKKPSKNPYKVLVEELKKLENNTLHE